jgi:phosphate transport system permease protein
MRPPDPTPAPADPPPDPRRIIPARLARIVAWLRGSEVNTGDRIFRAVTAMFAVGTALLLLLMAVELVDASSESLDEFGFSFLFSTDWDPVREAYGALPYIFGTVVSSLLALLIAVPIALGVAIFLTELAPTRLARVMGFLVELLAAVPSVVYGLWGIFVLAPWLRTKIQPALQSMFGWLPFFEGTPRGVGMLCGGSVLAIMILPTIASVSRDVLKAVPSHQREGALALGATRWETVRAVVLPFARSGIAGAIILGLGRALGETMAITMVIGNRAEISASLFDPSYSMAAVIANEFAEASSDMHLAALAEIGLVLFAVTVLLNIAARVLVWRVSRLPGGARAA